MMRLSITIPLYSLFFLSTLFLLLLPLHSLDIYMLYKFRNDQYLCMNSDVCSNNYDPTMAPLVDDNSPSLVDNTPYYDRYDWESNWVASGIHALNINQHAEWRMTKRINKEDKNNKRKTKNLPSEKYS